MRKNTLILISLVLLFSMPWFIALQLAKHPQWIKSLNPTNYGTWVKDDVKWDVQTPNTREWQLVLWQDKACDLACLKQLDFLGRVRLAMGRKVMLMNIWLYIPSQYPLSEQMLTKLKEHDVLVAYADKAHQHTWSQHFAKKPIVLITPEKKALLMYDANPEAKRMYHDFQRLIK